MKRVPWPIWLAVISGWLGTVLNENSNMGGIAWLIGVWILVFVHTKG